MHPHSGELSEPAARVGGGQHQCPVGLRDSVGDFEDLGGGQEAHLGSGLRWELDAAARRPGDQVRVDGRQEQAATRR